MSAHSIPEIAERACREAEILRLAAAEAGVAKTGTEEADS